MPIGGRLTLKGGLVVSKSGVEKKKSKKKKSTSSKGSEEEEGATNAKGISVMSNKTYEEEFSIEMSRAKTGKERSTPWGSGYGKAPEILHGYASKVTGKTAEERLDMRSAMKSDKFCK